jgi:Flp pilus assembly protein TadB
VTWVSVACAVLAVLWWLPGEARLAEPPRRTRSGSGLRPVAAAGVGAAAWLFVGGPAGPVAGCAAAAAGWWVLATAEPPSRRREREEVQRTLPHLVDLFASTLRSGAAPVAGLAQVCAALPGPAADRLAPVVERSRWGAGSVEAWHAIEGDDELAPLARAMVRSLTSGAPVVRTVERLADELARESAARAEDAARRVGVAAAVPLGVCLLPAFLLLGVVPTVASLFGSVAP